MFHICTPLTGEKHMEQELSPLSEQDFVGKDISTAALPAVPESPIPFVIPDGTADALLEKQIASCAGLIQHIAHYIARYDSAIDTCNNFMDRISALMRSSAEVGKVVGRLRGLEPKKAASA
jgi:hypothetical protein